MKRLACVCALVLLAGGVWRAANEFTQRAWTLS
jgi:hypothetical protein